MSAVPPIERKYGRRRSGTALWHMSRRAVALSLEQIYAMKDNEALEFLVQARFGGRETMRCPRCGSTGKHYWRPREKRWKCRGCDKTFSITSGTLFSHRKLKLQEIIAGALLWVNSAAGQPALELKRHLNKTYSTAFVLQHKLREALVRGYNVGLLSGDLEVDGAHQSGRRSAEKRGRPQGSAFAAITADTPEEKLKEYLLTTTGQVNARGRRRRQGVIDPEFGRRLPKDRRIVYAVRKRAGGRGRGAIASRVAVGLSEDKPIAEAVLRDFVAESESILNTDTSPAYMSAGGRFLDHRTVEHSKELVGPHGENNNLVEELNWRMDRAEQGVYLNLEPKYLLDYAVETAFRADTRRLSNGMQLRIALHIALNVGPSRYWRGFTRGRHRTVELLHPTSQTAPSSGPRKGQRPSSSANGRPPR